MISTYNESYEEISEGIYSFSVRKLALFIAIKNYCRIKKRSSLFKGVIKYTPKRSAPAQK